MKIVKDEILKPEDARRDIADSLKSSFDKWFDAGQPTSTSNDPLKLRLFITQKARELNRIRGSFGNSASQEDAEAEIIGIMEEFGILT